jgi:hypothetical protein
MAFEDIATAPGITKKQSPICWEEFQLLKGSVISKLDYFRGYFYRTENIVRYFLKIDFLQFFNIERTASTRASLFHCQQQIKGQKKWDKPLKLRFVPPGELAGTRTQGPYIKSVLLYQLSYQFYYHSLLKNPITHW